MDLTEVILLTVIVMSGIFTFTQGSSASKTVRVHGKQTANASLLNMPKGPSGRVKYSKMSTETTEDTDETESSLTNEEIMSLLTTYGYQTMNFTDGGPPLAFVGDVAFYPQQVLPELGGGSRSNIQSKRLWVDASGKQHVSYYYDTQTQADKNVFEQAVGTWASSTCIRFQRIQQGLCTENRGYGAICVGNFGGCWSLVGNNYVSGWQRSSQKMSVQPRGCEMVAAAHEFGHALGLQHEQSRADRSHYMFVNYHNLDIKLSGDLDTTVRQAWFQASMCLESQTVNVPIPYDYMSIMQYGASDFAEEDARIVYSARDARHQYMMDYHRNAGMAQTHYDKLVINVGYKCNTLWREACARNGKDTPKCKNHGFLNKDCTCECADGFRGSECGSRHGALYPVQDRAQTMLDITGPGEIDLADQGMHLENHNYILRSFVLFQFVTVTVHTGHGREKANIVVEQPFDAIAGAVATPHGQRTILQNMAVADCELSGFFYWGAAARNQLRTECLSSMFNNELPEQRLNLRGRNWTLDIVAIGFMGRLFRDPKISMKALELRLHVQFEINAAKQLRTFGTAAEDPGPLGDPMAGGRANRIGMIVGIVLAVLLVVAAICLIVAWKILKRGKR